MFSDLLPAGFHLTWLGHATFVLQLPNQKRIVVDPWITGNPSCPESWQSVGSLGSVDLMLITHGHGDHCNDAIAIAEATKCRTVAIYELIGLLSASGLPAKNEAGQPILFPCGKGGGVHLAELDLRVTLTHAFHSSSYSGGEGESAVSGYAGEPAGFIVEHGSGASAFTFYIAGDTALFGDMALIADLYKPTVAFLPIGDRFTMGPREAARATKLLSTSVKGVVPMHFATFPDLTGTIEDFAAAVTAEGISVDIANLEPGVTLGT